MENTVMLKLLVSEFKSINQQDVIEKLGGAL